MTPLVNISKAISSCPDFPWDVLCSQNGIILSEMKSYKMILELCRNDIIAGYRAAGTANAIPNLSYLSVSLLIKAGGIESLKNYRGIGPKNKNGVTLSSYLDELISQYKSDLKNLIGGYEKLKLLQTTEKSILGDMGIHNLIATFQSAADNLDEGDGTTDHSEKHPRSDDSDDDDRGDEGASSHPSSSRKRVRIERPETSGSGRGPTPYSAGSGGRDTASDLQDSDAEMELIESSYQPPSVTINPGGLNQFIKVHDGMADQFQFSYQNPLMDSSKSLDLLTDITFDKISFKLRSPTFAAFVLESYKRFNVSKSPSVSTSIKASIEKVTGLIRHRVSWKI